MDESCAHRPFVTLAALLLIVAVGRTAGATPCLIFVHGKQTNTDTYTDWNAARSYWESGLSDFIRTATNNFAASWYVVGYNGTQAYWDPQAAGEVANEIVNATNGGNDGGGNHCAQTWAQGGTFWVIAHSMGATVMDFILGNTDPGDPDYDLNGPYDVVGQRLTLAITLGGTHRGSQLADNVCGGGNFFCQAAGLIESCDNATYWLRSSDDVQVKTFSSAPARNVYLTGGYAAIFGPSACLAGEDDGLVQHASTYACNGSASTAYNNSNVCDDNNKQKPSGFHNLDTAHENHDQERNDTNRDNRQAIPTGLWTCGGGPCAAGTTVQSSLSTAELVGLLYATPTSSQPCDPGSASVSGNLPCLECFPGTFAPTPGATSCTPCPAGTVAADAGATSCAQCPADTYSAGGASACTSCPAGTSAPPGSSVCTANTTTTSTTSTSTTSSTSTSSTDTIASTTSTSTTSSSTSTTQSSTSTTTSSTSTTTTTTSTTSSTSTTQSSTSTTTSSTSTTTTTTSTTSSSTSTTQTTTSTTSSSTSTTTTSTTSSSTTSSSSTSSSSTSTTTTTSTTVSSTTTTTVPLPCGPAPATICRLAEPGGSSLNVKDSAVDTGDQVKWTWNRGAQTLLQDFHNPPYSSATYRLCLYDASGKPQPLLEADIPPGGTCGLKPCWKPTGLRGFVYKSRQGLPDGVVSLKLFAGTDGRAKIQAVGRGASLQTPALPLTLPVTAQLVIVNDGSMECWQTTFNAATTSQTSFRATGP